MNNKAMDRRKKVIMKRIMFAVNTMFIVRGILTSLPAIAISFTSGVVVTWIYVTYYAS